MSITWRDNWLIGIKEIDDQHKELFQRINNLLEACNNGKGRVELAPIIQFLSEYVVTHFHSEQTLMLKSNYPDYKRHKQLHDDFIRRFNELEKKLKTEGPKSYLIIETNRVVVGWLIEHIQNTDKKISTYLKESKQETLLI